MPILRAGPWGNLNSPHEDEPAVKDDQTNIYPVNCAREQLAKSTLDTIVQ